MFNFLRTLLARKRILETSGVFIPQIYDGSLWKGIEKDKSIGGEILWFDLGVQIERCGVKTFEEANILLQDYLDFNKKRIHLMKPEPKFWRILKTPIKKETK